MARVQRPAIEANIRPVPAPLDEPLRRIVALLAKGLKRPEPKLVHIAAMRLDVIADCCWRDDAALEAELAQRVLQQLVPANASPAQRAVPLIPLRRPAAVAHGLKLSSAGRSNQGPLAAPCGKAGSYLAISRRTRAHALPLMLRGSNLVQGSGSSPVYKSCNAPVLGRMPT